MKGMLHPEEGTSTTYWTRTATSPKLDPDFVTKKIFPVLPEINSILPNHESVTLLYAILAQCIRGHRQAKGKKQYF
jgi:hypothetical protein